MNKRTLRIFKFYILFMPAMMLLLSALSPARLTTAYDDYSELNISLIEMEKFKIKNSIIVPKNTAIAGVFSDYCKNILKEMNDQNYNIEERKLIDSQIDKLNEGYDPDYDLMHGVDLKIIEVEIIDDKNVAYATSDEEFIGYATKYTDLKNQIDVSVDDINYIIDVNLGKRKSILRGCGDAFIAASKETGLSPIFLLGLTASEAGWVVNPAHAKKNNPYSVNMTNKTGTKTGYVFGNTYKDGIINGAKWINRKYYLQGQTTLHEFIYGKKSYCVPGDAWISSILDIMNKSYRLLKNRKEVV